MRILITGGAGFIGSHVSDLLRHEHAVTVLDNLSTGRRENLPRGVRLLLGDVRDPEHLAHAFAEDRFEVVLHLAAQGNVRKSLLDPLEDASINVLGGIAVLRGCVTAGVRRFVFASSGGAIYGDQRRLPCPERATAAPVSPYGAAKLAVEIYAKAMRRAGGIEVVSLRLGNVFGPRQDPAGEAGIIAIFGRSMLLRKSPEIFGDGAQTRDLVYVGDVARAFERALAAPPGIYNIGTGTETSVLDVARLLAAATGFRGECVHRPAIVGEVRRNVLDVSRAARRMRWSASTPLREGLEATVRHLQGAPDGTARRARLKAEVLSGSRNDCGGGSPSA